MKSGASPGGPPPRRRWRLLLAAGVLLGLAPGTFVRTDIGHRADRAKAITVTPVDLGPRPPGFLALTGAWQLRSDHSFFGGFSALAGAGPDRLIAGSDRGFLLEFDLAKGDPRALPDTFRFIGREHGPRKEVIDLEGLTRDPGSGTLWASYEAVNQIERFGPAGARRHVSPPAMQSWSVNSGPEAMTRLKDGRFLILAEGSRRSGMIERPGLLYPGDPVEGAVPREFRFNCRAAFAPVDITEVPGGRVLILLRHVTYSVPATFDVAIMIADPAAIADGQHWRGAIIQRLSGKGYGENFEGIAFVPDRADPDKGTIWLIADDNFSIFQRSLLLRFAWPGDGAALYRQAAERAEQDYERALSGAQGPLVICPRIDAQGRPV